MIRFSNTSVCCLVQACTSYNCFRCIAASSDTIWASAPISYTVWGSVMPGFQHHCKKNLARPIHGFFQNFFAIFSVSLAARFPLHSC